MFPCLVSRVFAGPPPFGVPSRRSEGSRRLPMHAHVRVRTLESRALDAIVYSRVLSTSSLLSVWYEHCTTPKRL
jgi:hypothetical protein